MADSEEESDRRRSRDKFRRERSDYDNRRRPIDKREPFDERPGNGSGSVIQDDQNRQVNRRRSPLLEPPSKRSRQEYSDDRRSPSFRRKDIKTTNVDTDAIYRPPMIPFKRFLDPLDDLITEDEACEKYRDYKGNYTKKHIEDYFESHKNEEWFRLRYHPDFIDIRKANISASIKNRFNIFMELFDKGYFEKQSVQMDNSENLIKIMDAVVIKLEGGTDDDLKVLGECDRIRYTDVDVHDEDSGKLKSTKIENRMDSRSEGEEKSDPEDAHPVHSSESKPLDGDAQNHNSSLILSQNALVSGSSVRSHSSSSNSSNSSNDEDSDSGGSSSDDDDDDDVEAADDVNDQDVSSPQHTPQKEKKKNAKLNKSKNIVKENRLNITNVTSDIDDDVPTPTTAEAPIGTSTVDDRQTDISAVSSVNKTIVSASMETLDHQMTANTTIASNTSAHSENSSTKATTESSGKKLLHKTASIFFRALSSTLKESELKELCASQPGFKRVALWDPVPERRFTRHAWATYEPTVNIKKVCWALNTNPMLRDKISLPVEELGATVNRDLAQRVRSVTPLTRHKSIMRQDLLIAAKLVGQYDNKHNLWPTTTQPPPISSSSSCGGDSDRNGTDMNCLEFAIKSGNPLLKNLTDYLVDEGGSEEEALMAETNNSTDGDKDGTNAASSSVTSTPTAMIPITTDNELARVLDLIILYLRIVHSIDFYAATIYPMEDLMPHRCGILHARGDRGLNSTVTNNRSPVLSFSQREINEYIQNFQLKMITLLHIPKDLTEEEMKKLGMRDAEKAGEDFIEANIQKRTGKKKPFKVVWVCPLSDKKFREPIFVRKHIFNKHMDKVEAAKKDNAIFFNNYLQDSRRPSLPEAPLHMLNHYYPALHSNSGGGGGGIHHSNMHGSYYRGHRGGPGRMNYRGNSYRMNNNNNSNKSNSNSLLPSSGRVPNAFQDYYDGGSHHHHHNQQHHAMAAVAAAAAAAALYPNASAADLYALAAAGGGQGGGARQRGQRTNNSSPTSHNNNKHDYNNIAGGGGGNRSYGMSDMIRRRPNVGGYGGGNRRPYGSGERSVVSYNDLDEPGN